MFQKILFTLAFLLTISISVYSNDRSEGYKVGDKVSDFVIDNYDGSQYSLSNSGAKATVIIFVSTECPFVQPYTDRLISLNNEFWFKRNYDLGINSNKTEPTEEVMNHAKEKITTSLF
ncbi:MAG: redoxin domain-containing protein [Ignavibacteria bacterium]|nr:redoxin domain-containing protein [Ignavibacteria bacterium]